eukprot:2417794-Prymnesium_polylepis.1
MPCDRVARPAPGSELTMEPRTPASSQPEFELQQPALALGPAARPGCSGAQAAPEGDFLRAGHSLSDFGSSRATPAGPRCPNTNTA